MSRSIPFHKGEVIIRQGEEDTAAYLIQNGWLEVHRRTPSGRVVTATLGPGEIVGELGLAGLVPCRSATVTALTDGELERIDRGQLIRLVNGPGSRLTPLLAALFNRLRSVLIEEQEPWEFDDTVVMLAEVHGANERARQAMCDRPRSVTRLPWYFGAYIPPQSVTDLFRETRQVDLRLAGASRAIREQHVALEEAIDGGMQLHLMQHGDFCELDEVRVGYGSVPTVVPLPPGKHLLRFGEISDPFAFMIHVFDV